MLSLTTNVIALTCCPHFSVKVLRVFEYNFRSPCFFNSSTIYNPVLLLSSYSLFYLAFLSTSNNASNSC